MSQSSNHLRLVSWTRQWVLFTQMSSTVTRSQSNRAPLGETGDSHHGCAADKSAATALFYHVNMNQNLWGMFPTPCWIYARPVQSMILFLYCSTVLHNSLIKCCFQSNLHCCSKASFMNRSSDEAEMIIKFNVAYNIAKEELPFTKFKSEIILMKKNGLNVNPTYSKDITCAKFIGVIADT